jgi:hypothetical protein
MVIRIYKVVELLEFEHLTPCLQSTIGSLSHTLHEYLLRCKQSTLTFLGQYKPIQIPHMLVTIMPNIHDTPKEFNKAK